MDIGMAESENVKKDINKKNQRGRENKEDG